MSNTLPITKKTKDSLRFGNLREAVQAIQNTTLTQTTVVLLTNSAEHQAFVRTLAAIKRPVGIVLVMPKD
jgi:hypothetical protein